MSSIWRRTPRGLAACPIPSSAIAWIPSTPISRITCCPPPQDNTTLDPYSYTGSDPLDGIVTITGINLPPVASNDSYSITERAYASDPSLVVGAGSGVLANDTDPQGIPLTASLVSGPAPGSLTVNSDGSFIYTSNTGYLGADSFTYQASDGYNGTIATVSLTVTARLCIPTDIRGMQGTTVTVPVNLDNPDPAGSGGLVGASLAIDYNQSVLTFVSVQKGFAYGTGWDLEDTDNQASGLLGISLLNTNGTPNTSTVGGALVLITFEINSNASPGPSPIDLVASNTPGSLTVTTSLTPKNAGYDMSPRPVLVDGWNPGVDGIATVTAGLIVTSFSPTPGGFAVTFNKPFDPSTINLYTTGSLPDDVILATAATQISVRGSVVFNHHGHRFHLRQDRHSFDLWQLQPRRGAVSAGAYTVTLRSYTAGGGGFEDLLGNPLDGTGNSTGNYLVTFTVGAPGVAVGIPDFARGFSNTDAIFFCARP